MLVKSKLRVCRIGSISMPSHNAFYSIHTQTKCFSTYFDHIWKPQNDIYRYWYCLFGFRYYSLWKLYIEIHFKWDSLWKPMKYWIFFPLVYKYSSYDDRSWFVCVCVCVCSMNTIFLFARNLYRHSLFLRHCHCHFAMKSNKSNVMTKWWSRSMKLFSNFH